MNNELDKIINKMGGANTDAVNLLNKYLSQMSSLQIKKLNAIIRYEEARNNIRTIDDIIDISFNIEHYMYIEKGAALNLNADQIKNFNGKNKTLSDISDIQLYQEDKVLNNKKIYEFELVAYDGTKYKFKSNVIKALGLALTIYGDLYKKNRLCFSSITSYKDKFEAYKKLTGRKNFKYGFASLADMFGITKSNIDDKGITQLQIISANKNSKELERLYRKHEIVRIEDIENSIFELDSVFSESLAKAQVDLGYISKSPLELSMGTSKQKEELEKFISKPLKAIQIKKIIKYIMDDMRFDFQYKKFEPIALAYLNIAEGIEKIENEAEWE